MPCCVATVLLRLKIIELWSKEVAESIVTLLKLFAFEDVDDNVVVPVERYNEKRIIY